ncbi:hypothetical protein [Streptomyces sp. NPDC002685]|uniref:hypothetical protein n=1 Tax=Streptomyces sp. NPDC002685 TaxID=3154540 RepID=UPI00331A3047
MDGVTGGTALALLGVLPGTAGTLVGQYLAMRIELRRDQLQRADGRRAELKEAILGYLAAAQRIELILDRRDLGLPDSSDPADEKLHELWLAKEAVDLTCPHATAEAAHDYARALHDLMRNADRAEGSPAKRECRSAFMEVASGVLGLGTPPVSRRQRPPYPPVLPRQ